MTTNVDTFDRGQAKQALMQLEPHELINWPQLLAGLMPGVTVGPPYLTRVLRSVRAIPITDPMQALRAFDSSSIKSVWDEVYAAPPWSTEEFNKESFPDGQKPAGRATSYKKHGKILPGKAQNKLG
jgi:hypothetical protein